MSAPAGLAEATATSLLDAIESAEAARRHRAMQLHRLITAAREALAAYRAIFGECSCWNDRDRRAFAALAAALEDEGTQERRP